MYIIYNVLGGVEKTVGGSTPQPSPGNSDTDDRVNVGTRRELVALPCYCADRDLSSVAPRLYMRAGDLVELQNNDSTNGASTSASSSRGAESRDTSRGAGDVQLMYGRNVATGDRGSFPASSVYILPTIDRPSPDFIVSTPELHREKNVRSEGKT